MHLEEVSRENNKCRLGSYGEEVWKSNPTILCVLSRQQKQFVQMTLTNLYDVPYNLKKKS